MTHRVSPGRLVALLALACLVLVAMLLSSSQMADVRVGLPWLSATMNWLEMQQTPFDLDHVAFFALVGLAMRLLLPRASNWVLLLLLAALAGTTELLQFSTVGRTPRVADARDDVLGATLGLALGVLLLRLAGGVRRLRPSRPRATPEPAAILRPALAAWLVGHAQPAPGEVVDAAGAEAVLAAIAKEGIISAVEARLHDPAHATPMPLLQPLTVHALACRARGMRRSAEVARIQQVLDAAGIPALWLKGAALAHWLYPQPFLRDVADVDLLVRDHATALRVAALLLPHGYTLPNPHIAGDLVVHELLAVSERARLELDLHWDLSNAALFAHRLEWDELQADAMALPALAAGARGLGPVHALLHACMHRAANALVGQQDRLRWLYDIHLLATGFDADDWARTLAAAGRAGLADVVCAGLRASQAAFATALPAQVMARLDGQARREPVRSGRLGSWTYVQTATLRVLPRGQRLRWLRQLLVPDLAHLQVRYGADGAGHLRLFGRRLLDGFARWRGYVTS